MVCSLFRMELLIVGRIYFKATCIIFRIFDCVPLSFESRNTKGRYFNEGNYFSGWIWD